MFFLAHASIVNCVETSHAMSLSRVVWGLIVACLYNKQKYSSEDSYHWANAPLGLKTAVSGSEILIKVRQDSRKRTDVCILSYEMQGIDAFQKMCSRKCHDTMLIKSARLGKVDMIRKLHTEQKVNLEQSNCEGKRALHEAAQMGHLSCVQYLINSGVDIDPLKRSDWTPLMLACTKTNYAVIDALVKAGAQASLCNKDGWNAFHIACRTPLMLACTKTNYAVIDALVKAGAQASLCNKDGWNAFHIACRTGDTHILSLLLTNDQNLWDTVSKNGRTPLHTTALHGRLEATQLLLATASYTVDTCDRCGSTPLMDAVRSGHSELAKLLIEEHGADISAEDNMGYHCLHLAVQVGSDKSARFLLEQCGVDVNLASSVTGVTPLHVACKGGQHAMVELLIGFGADINSTDKKNRTALHMACGSQQVQCVRILVQNGMRDSKDSSGRTAKSLTYTPLIKDLILDLT